MVKWTPKSEKDLSQILEYIAKNHGVALAIEVINELDDKVELMLDDNSLCGFLVETSPLFSKITVLKNTIYYCENPKDRDIYIVYVRARKTDYDMERLKTIFPE